MLHQLSEWFYRYGWFLATLLYGIIIAELVWMAR